MLVSENDFTKVFKYGETDLYVTKAYDEDSDEHYLIACIPQIKELGESDIKYPLTYDNELLRDAGFREFDYFAALNFMDALIYKIKSQQEAKQRLIEPN